MTVTVITTVLVPATATPPADPYDLTTLAVVKDELTLDTTDTSKDAFLQRAISQLSTAIRNECNRIFQVEAVSDLIYVQQDPYPWQTPGGVRPLQLSRWPLVDTVPIAFSGNTHGSTAVDGIASTAGMTAGSLVFAQDGTLPAGTAIQTVASNSLVLTRAASSSETALSMNTGLFVQQNWNGQLQNLVYGVDYTVDAKNGWLIRLDKYTGADMTWEAVPTTVTYRAGFATIPYDLVDGMLRMITGRYYARGRDPMLVEQDQPQVIGRQRWWFGSQPGQQGQFAPEIQGLIDNYRVPVIA